MNLQNTQKNKNILALALVSALASVLFSFLGAPFLRALFVSAKSIVFWTTGVLLVGILFVAGRDNYKISETAVYVGAIWMTLGTYGELEKQGIRWTRAGFFSLCSGLLFGIAGYFLILKNQTSTDLLAEIVEPLRLALNKAFPDSQQESRELIDSLPGSFAASLVTALAFSFAFESGVTRMFKIQREKLVSSLRWLEFRLPSVVIWIALISALSTELGRPIRVAMLSMIFSNSNEIQSFIQNTSANLLIVSAVAFFFQGIAIIETVLRVYSAGSFTRIITYMLIVLQLTPVVVLLGFVDYWADFRRRVRKKIKTT